MTKHTFRNTLYMNDNLYVLSGLNSELVDLIYLDPPFNTKRMYSAPAGSRAAGARFKDTWTWHDVDECYLDALAGKFPALVKYLAHVGEIHSQSMMAYLTFMAQRIVEMHRILKDTGSLYLHCDPMASHYLKSLLDAVFGKNNFRNEIVWSYKSGGASKKSWSKKHDIILYYVKSDRFCFNVLKDKNYTKAKGRKPGIINYGAGQAEFFEDDDGVFNLVNARDVWEIPYLNSQSKERTGYPTQKPLALLKRIILASSNEGDIVMDPFCGCATTCVAAHQLGRKWIGIDIEKQAVNILVERLSDETNLFKDFTATKRIPRRSDLKFVSRSHAVREQLYNEQQGNCNACGKDFALCNLEIDSIIPKSKGGGNYYENYQLLCSLCKRIKCNRLMEYLRIKIGCSRDFR